MAVAWLALQLSAGVARAQDASKLAAAEALFDEAKRLMDRGDYAEASSKFAASLRVDAGVGAMLYLAECYVHLGRTASAWAQFRAAASLAASRQDPRDAVARRRAAELEGQLSTLTITLSEPDLPGIVVRRDGQLLERAAWTSPVPSDPGVHVIEVTATGKRSFISKVTVGEEPSAGSVVVPPLADLQEPLAPPPVARAVPTGDASGRTTRPAPAFWVGVSTGGLAILGFGVGAAEGFASVDQHRRAVGECHGDCSQSVLAQQDQSSAKSSATIANVSFAAGGALASASIVLVLVGLAHESQAPRSAEHGRAPGLNASVFPLIGPGLRGCGIGGTW
jgi:hypothetical protein